MDMQKLRGKDELCCSLMWHQAALCSAKKAKQLTYYQEAITSAIVRFSLWRCIYISSTHSTQTTCSNLAEGKTEHEALLPSRGASMSWHLRYIFAFAVLLCTQCAETQKCQMVGLLIEFGAWLYCHNFPKADAQHQLQWAIDVLLNLDPEQAEGAGTVGTNQIDLSCLL